MPFASIHKFQEFDEFHQAAQGLVRTRHEDIQVFRFKDIGRQVVSEMPLFRVGFYQIGLMHHANFNISINEYEHTLRGLYGLVFFKPGQLIRFRSDPGWEGYVLMFKENFLSIHQNNKYAMNEFSLLDPTTESFTIIDEASYISLAEIYEKMLYEYEQTDLLRNLPVIELYIHILFHKIELFCQPKPFAQAPTLPTRKAYINYEFKKLLQQHLRTTKSVSDFADMLHITPKYLIEAVTETSGKSPKELISERILSETKTLLRFSEYPISEIAAAYNFKDQAHFTNFFKQKSLLSPLEYRYQAGE